MHYVSIYLSIYRRFKFYPEQLTMLPCIEQMHKNTFSKSYILKKGKGIITKLHRTMMMTIMIKMRRDKRTKGLMIQYH